MPGRLAHQAQALDGKGLESFAAVGHIARQQCQLSRIGSGPDQHGKLHFQHRQSLKVGKAGQPVERTSRLDGIPLRGLFRDQAIDGLRQSIALPGLRALTKLHLQLLDRTQQTHAEPGTGGLQLHHLCDGGLGRHQLTVEPLAGDQHQNDQDETEEVAQDPTQHRDCEVDHGVPARSRTLANGRRQVW